MMRIKQISKTIVTLALVSFVAAPLFAARGRANFTTFVTLGDSYGAGVSSVGLNIRHQRYSWPAVIARQVGLNTNCTTDGPKCFQIPYISEPGILPELELTSLAGPTIVLKPGLGAPLNSGLPRPYNNLSIDGGELADQLNGPSGDGNERLNSAIVIRGLGAPVDQALRLNPTFIALWIGGNDALNGVQSGRPALMTSVADFTRDYNALLDKLVAGAPNAGIVVGNLPVNILDKVPYTTLVPIFLVDQNRQPVRDSLGNLIPLIGHLGGTQFGPLPAGTLLPITTRDLIAQGYGIPAPLKPLIPLPHVGEPLPDEAVLTPGELTTINQRVADFNGVITAAAAARDIPVADINALFHRVANGTMVGPFRFDTNFITGGFFSLDGYHLTDIGYTLFANEYIRTINTAYKTRIPVSPVAQFFQNDPPPMLPTLTPEVTFSPEAMEALRSQFAPPAKRRSTRR